MEVNFDNLRKQLAQPYNELVKQLNAARLDLRTNGVKDWNNVFGNTLLQSEDLAEPLAEMQNLIGTLAACYNGNDVNDISEEIELIPNHTFQNLKNLK